MDVFNYVSTLNPTAIYSNLFQASIALAGFIAIFIVFSYQTLDNRVDHRKDILRSLLAEQIKIAPYIAVIIQNMNEEANSTKDLWQQINKQLKNRRTNKQKLNETEKAVIKFARDIYGYKKFRDIIVCFGIVCISFWTVLSLKYLLVILVSPCISNKSCCFEILTLFSIVLFTISMFLTLAFIIFSLKAKAKCFNPDR